MSTAAERLGVKVDPKPDTTTTTTTTTNEEVITPGKEGGAGTEEEEQIDETIDTGNEEEQEEEVDEAAEAQALAIYNKKNKTDFKSWDEVATFKPPVQEESPEKKAARRRKEVLKFAIDNEVVSVDEYDNYQRDKTRDARDLVFQDFYNKRKAAGRTDIQIDAEFTRLYGEDLDDADETNAAVKSMRNEDLKKEAERVLRNKYPWTTTLDQKYDQHVAARTQEITQKQQVSQLTTQYVSDVNEIFAGITSRKITIGDKDKVEFETEFDFTKRPDILNNIKKEFLKREAVLAFIANYNRAALQDAITIRLERELLPSMISNTARKYHSKKMEEIEFGRKNLNRENPGGGSPVKEMSGEGARRLQEAGYIDESVPVNQ